MVARERVAVRLDSELLAWADEYARQRRWTRTTVVEAALEALRGDAGGGVPEPPRRPSVDAVRRERAARPAPAEKEEPYVLPKIAKRRFP